MYNVKQYDERIMTRCTNQLYETKQYKAVVNINTSYINNTLNRSSESIIQWVSISTVHITVQVQDYEYERIKFETIILEIFLLINGQVSETLKPTRSYRNYPNEMKVQVK